MQTRVKGGFVRVPLAKRLESKIDKSGDCWIWLGYKNARGYGTATVDKKFYRIHRAMYELHKGEVPLGLELDHLCKNTSCVNPDHLEAVTHRENILRANMSKPRPNRRKYHEIKPCPCCGKLAPMGKAYCNERCRNTYLNRMMRLKTIKEAE